jgi:hypothetical protein
MFKGSLSSLIGRKITANSLDSKSAGGAVTSADFRQYGRQTVDYICDYVDNIESRRVILSLSMYFLFTIILGRSIHCVIFTNYY